MLADDCHPHRSYRAVHWRQMEHGEESTLGGPLDRRGPSVSARRARMANQVEDVHRAFPYRLAVESLSDRNRLGERRCTAVHALDSFAELIDFYFVHASPISRMAVAAPPEATR